MISVVSFKTTIAHSHLIQQFQQALRGSILRRKLREVIQMSEESVPVAARILSTWWQSSVLWSIGRRSHRVGGRILASAGIMTTMRQIMDWTRQSFLYGWLTKEPEPDVIVIDLRDTYSVGPIIGWLDRAIARCIPITESATVTEMFRAARRYVNRRPVRALSIVIIGSVMADIIMGIVTFSLSRQGLLLRFGLLGVALWGTRSRRTLPEILASQPVQFVIKLLEPPEPVEPERGRDDLESDEAE